MRFVRSREIATVSADTTGSRADTVRVRAVRPIARHGPQRL